VDENSLEWIDLLARGLMVVAIVVLVASALGALAIGSSSSDIPIFGDIQQQNRGTLALFAFGFGVTSAGVLSGLGAIIRLLVAAERRARE
jgi:hypothetical protein